MRLIDADEMKKELKDMDVVLVNHNVEDWIDEQPTVDAVPVVRCKDCEHHTELTMPEKFQFGNNVVWCDFNDCRTGKKLTRDDKYCGYGKRKEGE